MLNSLYNLFREKSCLTSRDIDELLNYNNIELILIKNKIIERFGNDYVFSSLGEFMFYPASYTHFYYFVNSYLCTIGKETDQTCFYQQFLKLKELFLIHLPKYQRRDKLVRFYDSDVDADLLMFVVGKLLKKGNIYSAKIIIEQDDFNGMVTLSCESDKRFFDDRKYIVNFLKSIHLIKDCSRKLRIENQKGLVIERNLKNNTIFQIGFQNRVSYIKTYSTLSNKERAVLEYVNEYGKASRADILNALDISERSSSRVLNRLVDKKELVRIGSKGTRNSFYKLNYKKN